MVTILIPHKDTPEPLLIRCLESVSGVSKHYNTPVIIIDDKSKKKNQKKLKKLVKKLLPQAILEFSKDHQGQPGALYRAAKLAQTEYILKHDSDDILYDLPENFQNTTADFYMPNFFPITREQWFIRHREYNGGMIKRKLYLNLYQDHKNFLPLWKFIPEDIFGIGKYFIYFKKLKIQLYNTMNYKKIEHPDNITANRGKNGITRFGARRFILPLYYYMNPNFVLDPSPHYKTPLEFINFIHNTLLQREENLRKRQHDTTQRYNNSYR